MFAILSNMSNKNKNDVKERLKNADQDPLTENLLPKEKQYDKKIIDKFNKIKITNVNYNKIKFDALKNIQIYAYSVGHYFNDLSATIWMTYFVIYLSDI